MTSPVLWYLNRGTGVVLLLLMSLTTVLGVLATGRAFAPLWPRFVTQGIHRALGGLTVALLAAHALSAVVDQFVDIRWWQAFWPVGATYRPLWLGLGTVGLDLTVVVAVTAWLRNRMSPGAWRSIHLLSYAAWAVSVLHGVTIGTDSGQPWLMWASVGCVTGVAASALARVVTVVRREREVPA
jgi:sulfoxide reductase heme-binding subunit YedZ